MSILKVKDGSSWVDIPAIKGDTGDPAADESITDAMLVPDGIKTEVAWLWGNQLTDELEGEIVRTEDAYTGPIVSLGVDGKSTQVTTTGKNLFDKNNHGYWDGSIGTEGHHAGPTSPDYSYFRIPVTEGDVVYASNPAGAHRLAWSNGLIAIDSGISFPYTVPADIDEVSGYFEKSKFSYATVTINNSDVTYEPYSGGIASPSPDWPQPIFSVDELGLEITPYSGIVLEQGGFDADGKNNTANFNTRVRTTGFMPVTVGDTLTVDGDGVDLYVSISWYATDNLTASRIGYVDWGTLPFTATVPTGAAYARMLFKVTNGGLTWFTPEYVSKLSVQSLANGNYLHVYVPDLLPEGTDLCSLPDGTCDALNLAYLKPSTRAGWAWYSREVTRRVGEYYVDGVTGTVSYWNAYEKNVRACLRRWVIHDRATSNKNALMCDKFQIVDMSVFNKQSEEWLIAPYNGSYGPFFQLPDTSLSSEALVNAWFAEHPTTVRYAYDDSHITTETLDPIELPILPSDQSTVWCDPSANLKIGYILDSNLVVQSLEEAISDLATS